MGSGQSTNRYTQIRPFSNSLRQPLLGYDDECMEQQQHEIELHQKKNAALEKEIRELKSIVSKLESKAQSNASELPPPPPLKTLAIKGQKVDTTLEKEVNELKHRVAKLESLSLVSPFMKKQEEALNTLKEKNAALEDKLITIVDQMNAVDKPEPVYMNDLLGCLAVIIFLISILIGVNL